jgi:hypothetical protein
MIELLTLLKIIKSKLLYHYCVIVNDILIGNIIMHNSSQYIIHQKVKK